MPAFTVLLAFSSPATIRNRKKVAVRVDFLFSVSQGRLLGGAMGGAARPRSAHHREVHRSGASEKWAIGWKARLASLLLTHVGGSGWGLEWLQEPKWLERTIVITKIRWVSKIKKPATEAAG